MSSVVWCHYLGKEEDTIKLHRKLQASVERFLFSGKTSPKSEYVTFALGNFFLMLILFYFFLNNVAYDWTGSLYPEGTGFQLGSVFGSFDGSIPFVPEMVVFYVYLFYGLAVFTMIYFAFVSYRRGYALGWSLVIINAMAILVYILFPVSTYSYRVELLAHPDFGNYWATQVYDIFATDTSFNCFPSLHAAVSTICAYSWFKYYNVKPRLLTKAIAIAAIVIAVGVVLSTLLIKQHYIVDEIAGVALAYVVGKLVFSRLWKDKT